MVCCFRHEELFWPKVKGYLMTQLPPTNQLPLLRQCVHRPHYSKIGTPSVHVGSLKLRLYIAKHCHHAKHAG